MPLIELAVRSTSPLVQTGFIGDPPGAPETVIECCSLMVSVEQPDGKRRKCAQTNRPWHVLVLFVTYA